MNRTQIINLLCKKINAQSYLEIGTREGRNFDAIQCKKKVGVDPDINAKATFTCTSDQYFTLHYERKMSNYDIIFIDGMHEHNQVMRDVINSLKVLNENGFIICHDMNPVSEIMQIVPRKVKMWTGDCWKAWVNFRTKRNDLIMFVVNCDFGVGVIRRGYQDILHNFKDVVYWDYREHLSVYRKELLNLITVKQFEKWIR